MSAIASSCHAGLGRFSTPPVTFCQTRDGSGLLEERSGLPDHPFLFDPLQDRSLLCLAVPCDGALVVRLCRLIPDVRGLICRLSPLIALLGTAVALPARLLPVLSTVRCHPAHVTRRW